MTFLIISTVCISIIGTLSHFLYDISKHNKVIGLFAAVNESVWEHIKIALTPTILWGLLDGYLYGMNPNYFLAKAVSLALIIIVMPSLFYGYQMIFKKNNFIFDIIVFYIVIIVSQVGFYHLIQMNPVSYLISYIGCIGLFIIFGCYMVLTLMPIKSKIFKDPISNKYGFKGHTELEHNDH